MRDAERYDLGERGYVAMCAALAGVPMREFDALPAEMLQQRPDPVIPLEDDDGR